MKSKKAIVMIITAIVIAIIAVILAFRWISQQSSISTSKVAIAAFDVNPGTRLTADMVKLSDWPAGSVLKDSFTDTKLLESRVAKVSMQRGEPFTEAKLAPVGATGGLSAVIADGKRAITVRVNDVVGVAGFALPGNYVDILVSTKDDKGEKNVIEGAQNVSKLVLERILVLAVAQEAAQDQTKPKVVNAVTLEVTPEQAEKLDLARSIGQLSLVLRNQVDSKPTETSGATKKTLLHEKEKPQTTEKSDTPVRTKKAVSRKSSTSGRWCQEIITGPSVEKRCY